MDAEKGPALPEEDGAFQMQSPDGVALFFDLGERVAWRLTCSLSSRLPRLKVTHEPSPGTPPDTRLHRCALPGLSSGLPRRALLRARRSPPRRPAP